MTYIAIAYAIDILELFVLRFKNGKLWLVPYPQQGFSLYRLLLHLISHVTSPFITAASVPWPQPSARGRYRGFAYREAISAAWRRHSHQSPTD